MVGLVVFVLSILVFPEQATDICAVAAVSYSLFQGGAFLVSWHLGKNNKSIRRYRRAL